MALQVCRGERGGWSRPVKKKSAISNQSRRKLLKRGLAVVGAVRAWKATAGFVAFSEPREDEHASTSSTTESA